MGRYGMQFDFTSSDEENESTDSSRRRCGIRYDFTNDDEVKESIPYAPIAASSKTVRVGMKQMSEDEEDDEFGTPKNFPPYEPKKVDTTPIHDLKQKLRRFRDLMEGREKHEKDEYEKELGSREEEDRKKYFSTRRKIEDLQRLEEMEKH